MGHGYVERMFGDNCHFPDSSQKRFWRQHYERPVNVFNFGCGSGYTSDICGGFGWGNFPGGCYCGDNNFSWGWFAAGAVTSILGWIGMFAFGNNNNNGAFSVSGGHLGTSASDGSHRPYRGRSISGGAGGAGGAGDIITGNKDTEKLDELAARLEKLVAKTAVGDSYESLLEDLDEVIAAPLDDANKDADIRNYNRLKAQVERAKNGDPETIREIKINVGDITINEMSDLDNITLEDIQKLDETQARLILLKLGYIDDDAGSAQPDEQPGTTHNFLCGKTTNNPKIMQLLCNAKITTEFYHGQGGRNDNWMAGLIEDLNVDASSGRVTRFTLNCDNAGRTGFKGSYAVEITYEGDSIEYKFTEHSGNNRTIVQNASATLTFVEEKQCLTGNITALKAQ